MRRLALTKDNKNLFNNTMNHDFLEPPKEWSIISALNYVLAKSSDSQLSPKFFEECQEPLEFLTDQLGLTPVQSVFLSILIEEAGPITWRGFGLHLRNSRLSMMVYTEEIEDMIEKGWVFKSSRHENGSRFEAFALEKGVITALRHNEPFVPEKLDGMDIQTFVDRLDRQVEVGLRDNDIPFSTHEEWMIRLCKANPQLPLCRKVLQYEYDRNVQSLLLMAVVDYNQFADSGDEGLTQDYVKRLYIGETFGSHICRSLLNGSHILQEHGYLEHKCEDGIANPQRVVLSRKCREELLQDFQPCRSKCESNPDLKGALTSYTVIREKAMFYNADEQEQVDRLASLLQPENLQGIQDRLAQEGMRRGVACLFYGAPGTGKTETVLQLARQTGRDIMQIDIAGMRDKYVGESEKNIKAVFSRYKELCKHCEVLPILFFNEADGIFGKRSTLRGNNPTVEKMDNAMQNIILQEMENLEGILIATTNLTCNLDAAFERRFLFKIEFHKPDTMVKANLWRSMLGGDISEEDAKQLASRYDFSGGQIENIARKRTINYILTGKHPGFSELEQFCQHESMSQKSTQRRPIGFC